MMNKWVKYGIIGLSAVWLLAGCNQKTAETPTETSIGETDASPSDAASIDPGKVTLGNYKGMEFELGDVPSVEVTDEDLEAQINQILAGNPEYVDITDRPAQNGDTVNIDYVGKKDGVAFEGGTSAGYDLELGSHSFIDGFEEGLVGANLGDKLNLDLVFPDPYSNPDLAGQPVVFEVTVNSIQEKRTPELTDAFVQENSDFTTVAEFREDVRADMTAFNEEQVDGMKKSLALMRVIEASTFELSPEAVQLEYDRKDQMSRSNAGMYGMSLEDFLAMQGMAIADYEAKLKEDSELVVKQKLVVDAICEAEGLGATDESRQEVADREGMSVEELVQNYGQEAVDEVAKVQVVVAYLVSNSQFK